MLVVNNDLPPDEPLVMREFVVLEAIHRVTNGMDGAWADERLVRKTVRELKPDVDPRGLRMSYFVEVGLIDRGSVSIRERSGEARPRRRGPWGEHIDVCRMSQHGAAEHFSWRPDLLPELAA